MTARSFVRPVFKEARALAFPWLACLAAMMQPVIADSPNFLGGLSAPAYFVGTAALGALAIGHEYSSRTLSLLLSVPIQRTRLLAMKLGVLTAFLLLLCAAADTFVFGDVRLPQSMRHTASWVPVFGGLFLAPWLTMVCRSALGGAVFTIGLEGALYVIGELLGIRFYGGGAVMEAFRLAFVWYGTIALCIVGGAMTWRLFWRLEAIEGPGQQVHLAYWLRGAGAAVTPATDATRRRPVWRLVQKELHLQQLSLALAALFVLGAAAALVMTTRVADPAYGSLFAALTFLYAGILPIVIGASASAGERQIGTLEWQILQPIEMWKQWGIKVGVVFGLASVLTVGLPMTLLDFGRLIVIPGTATVIQPDRWMVMVLILFTTGSLYVSSLSRSAVWALAMSMPATLAATAIIRLAWHRIAPPVERMTREWALHFLRPDTIGAINDARIVNWVTVFLILGFVTLILQFAFTNHRSADRASVRVWRQLAILAMFAIGAVTLHAAAIGVVVANNLLQLPPQLRITP